MLIDRTYAQPTHVPRLADYASCVYLNAWLAARCDVSKAAACVERARVLTEVSTSVCTGELGHVWLDDGCPPPPGKPHWHLRLLQASTAEQPD